MWPRDSDAGTNALETISSQYVCILRLSKSCSVYHTVQKSEDAHQQRLQLLVIHRLHCVHGLSIIRKGSAMAVMSDAAACRFVRVQNCMVLHSCPLSHFALHWPPRSIKSPSSAPYQNPSLTAFNNHNVMQLCFAHYLDGRNAVGLIVEHIGVRIAEIGLGGSWEIILLDGSFAGGRRRDLLASTSNQILSLCCSCSSILLHGFKPCACVLSS